MPADEHAVIWNDERLGGAFSQTKQGLATDDATVVAPARVSLVGTSKEAAPAVVILLVGQVLVDLFFRIEYIRHVLLRGFSQLTFKSVAAHPKNVAAEWEALPFGAVLLLTMLRDDADAVLGPLSADEDNRRWLKQVGVLHIDDEKLNSGQRTYQR
jgi:hypothetical protein